VAENRAASAAGDPAAVAAGDEPSSGGQPAAVARPSGEPGASRRDEPGRRDQPDRRDESGRRDEPGRRGKAGRQDKGGRQDRAGRQDDAGRNDAGRHHGRDSERGWRELAGSTPSQVGIGGALRARDVARPTAEDLAAAERTVVVVRRQWQPPEG
jgi:hypothetical protein